MKKFNLLFGLVLISASLFVIPVSISADEIKPNVLEISTDIDTYIEENMTKATDSNSKSNKHEAMNSLNRVVLDEDKQIHYLNAIEQTDGEVTLTDTYYNTLERGTQKTLYTNFYVGLDYVGRIHCYATQSKYYTSTGQPYYKWSNAYGFFYDYIENNFHVVDSSLSIKNTAKYKDSSYVKQWIKWDTNKSSTTSGTVYFYAPKNK